MTAPRPLQDTDVIARVETIVATDMDGETIMMSVETGQYFHLDDIATTVWTEIEQPRNIDHIVSHLRKIYDVKADECRSDTLELIAKLRDLNVLRVIEA